MQPTCRRSRERANPGRYRGRALKSLDPRLRGDDGWNRRDATHLMSFPRKRAPLYFGGAEYPGLYPGRTLKSLDPRIRGDDGLGGTRCNPPVVVPANARTQGVIEAGR